MPYGGGPDIWTYGMAAASEFQKLEIAAGSSCLLPGNRQDAARLFQEVINSYYEPFYLAAAASVLLLQCMAGTIGSVYV